MKYALYCHTGWQTDLTVDQVKDLQRTIPVEYSSLSDYRGRKLPRFSAAETSGRRVRTNLRLPHMIYFSTAAVAVAAAESLQLRALPVRSDHWQLATHKATGRGNAVVVGGIRACSI